MAHIISIFEHGHVFGHFRNWVAIFPRLRVDPRIKVKLHRSYGRLHHTALVRDDPVNLDERLMRQLHSLAELSHLETVTQDFLPEKFRLFVRFGIVVFDKVGKL